MKKLALYSFMAVSMLSLNACIEHTERICTDDKLTDWPRIEGKRVIRTMNEKFELKEIEVQIARIAKGEYEIDNTPVRVCTLGSNTIIEQRADSGNFESSDLQVTSDQGLVLKSHLADVRDLTNHGINYRIEKRQTKNSILAKLPIAFGNDTYEVLVIDNTKGQDLAPVLQKSGIGFSLF